MRETRKNARATFCLHLPERVAFGDPVTFIKVKAGNNFDVLQ